MRDRLAGGTPAWRTRRGRLLLRALANGRLTTAAFAGVAALCLAVALRPSTPGSVSVLAATHDLDGGAPLRVGDLKRIALPRAAVPDGALHSGAVGRVLAAPVRRGEPLTDARLVGRRLLRGYGDGLVAAPVRVADAQSARMLRAGQRVDVLAADNDDGSELAAHTVASDVPVIAVPHSGAGSGEQGALIMVAATPDESSALAQAAADGRLSIAMRPN